MFPCPFQPTGDDFMGKHLSQSDRIKMETMLNSGHKVIEIAEYLHVHRSTIYREMKRGEYTHRNSDYTEELRYSSDLGQKNHDWNAQGKGRNIKIGNDLPLAEYIEDKIVNDKYSPEAALIAVAESGIEFSTTISVRTLYRYIDNGIFLKLTNKDLPVKGKRKNHNKKVKVQKRASIGESIENRPDEVDNREIFGHWEMDTVKGCREKGKRMLTMLFVEQNLMLIFLMRDGKADTVVEQLDWLTAALGLETFKKLFPVILTDNGSEFKHTREMEFTVDGQRRTRIYYCDPQASWQKPHVEKNHEYIRYVLPKGKSFSPYTQEDIILVLNHINSTRRSKLGGKTPFELADSEEFQQLKAVMGLEAIPADEVDLTPRLLKKK